MLRVRETATAELLTRQLPKVEVYATALMSGATDSSDPHGNTAFTSNTQDRISTTSVPLIEPAHFVALPKGQCYDIDRKSTRLNSSHQCAPRMPSSPCNYTFSCCISADHTPYIQSLMRHAYADFSVSRKHKKK